MSKPRVSDTEASKACRGTPLGPPLTVMEAGARESNRITQGLAGKGENSRPTLEQRSS